MTHLYTSFNVIFKMSKRLVPLIQTLICNKHFSMAPTSYKNINLVGRNLLRPTCFSSEETKSLLWTAMDLKQLFLQKCCSIDIIKATRITLLMHEPCMEIQASAMSAANLLHAHLNIVTDPVWDTREFAEDAGSFFSTCSDMVFCQSKYQSKIEKFAQCSAIPVVCVKSCTYVLLQALADIMALQERYGHVKNLNLGWIGRACPLLNTYLCIAPKFGLNVQFFCFCGPGMSMSPATLLLGKKVSKEEHTSLLESYNPGGAIKSVHVISMSAHDMKEHRVTLDYIARKADVHWSFLHKMPRGSSEVAPEVFDHPNSLVWVAKGNLQWIYAALMLRLLRTYEHDSEQPEYDKNVTCYP